MTKMDIRRINGKFIFRITLEKCGIVYYKFRNVRVDTVLDNK